jgi:hypothetical protein
MDIFLSAKTGDRTATLLHTFLSSRDFSRRACFEAECGLARESSAWDDTWSLPQRLVQDIEKLTPAESLLVLQRLKRSGGSVRRTIEARLATCCESQLLDVPSLIQTRHLSTEQYLLGKVSATELIDARLEWLREQGATSLPSATAALNVFKEIDERLAGILMRNEQHYLDTIATVLRKVVKKGSIDATIDIFTLSVFCAFRRLAIDEVRSMGRSVL